MPTVWVRKGSKAGFYETFTEEEAARADAEGWAAVLDVDKAPHPQADSFFADRQAYMTRELRSGSREMATASDPVKRARKG